jgi:hypothetical protein
MNIKKNSIGTKAAVAAAVISISTAGWLAPAFALGLGEILQKSYLGQPFAAEVPVYVTDQAELDSVVLRPASAADYGDLGLEYPSVASRISVTVEKRGDHYVAIMRSSTPISEPIITLLLEGVSTKGVVKRAYTILLEPEVIPGADAESAKRSTVQSKSTNNQSRESVSEDRPVSTEGKRESSSHEQVVAAYRAENPSLGSEKDQKNERGEESRSPEPFDRNKRPVQEAVKESSIVARNIVPVQSKNQVPRGAETVAHHLQKSRPASESMTADSPRSQVGNESGSTNIVEGASNLHLTDYGQSNRTEQKSFLELLKGLFSGAKKAATSSPSLTAEGIQATTPLQPAEKKMIDSALKNSEELAKGADVKKGGVKEVPGTESYRLGGVAVATLPKASDSFRGQMWNKGGMIQHPLISIREIGERPSHVSVVTGSKVKGNVVTVLKSIVPKGWAGYAMDPGVGSVAPITWGASKKPWIDALDGVLYKNGLRATINWNKKEVEFVTFKSR